MRNLNKKSFLLGIFLGAGISSFFVHASAFMLPHAAFEVGEVISAKKVNENFQAIVNKINNGVLGSSSMVANNLYGYDEVNLSEIDSGKFFIVHDAAKLNLPLLSSVNPGFTLKISQKLGGQTQIIPRAGDMFSGSDHYLVLENSNNSSGYIEIISIGTEWVETISSNNSFTRVDPSKIYLGTCSGNGTGNVNCYTNPLAIDTSIYGYVLINNAIHEYTGSLWRKLGTASFEYLVNDINSHLPPFSYTRDYELAMNGPLLQNGIIYVDKSNSGSYAISGILNLSANLINHSGTNIDNDLNEKIEGNFYNASTGVYQFGSPCHTMLGKDWKMVTQTQAGTLNLSTGQDYWTASSGTTANEYIYVDNMGTISSTTNTNLEYKGFVCVYTP